MDEYQHRKSGWTFDSVVIATCVFAAVLVVVAALTLINQERQLEVDDPTLWSGARVQIPSQRGAERSAYYRNCDAARAAGVAPIPAGAPGYRSELDGDADGLACEPYRR